MKLIKWSWLVGVLVLFGWIFLYNSATAQGISNPNFWKRVGTVITLLNPTWTLGDASNRIDIFADQLDATSLVVDGVVGGDLIVNGQVSASSSLINGGMTLNYDGTMAVVSSTSGEIHFFPKVGLGNATTSADVLFAIVNTKRPSSGTTVSSFLETFVSPTVGGLSIIGELSRTQTSSTTSVSINQLAGEQNVGRHYGTGPATDVVGSVNDGMLSGFGDALFLSGAWSRVLLGDGGSAANAFGHLIPSPNISGTGTVGVLVGLEIDPQTSGTSTSYALRYDNGSNSVLITGDGHLVIGATTTSAAGIKFENFGHASTTSITVSNGSPDGAVQCKRASDGRIGFCSSVVGVTGLCTCN